MPGGAARGAGVSAVAALVQVARRQARARRAGVFREAFALGPATRILDIGSEDGSAIAAVIEGTPVRPPNVYIADIDEARVCEGARRFGFVPVPIPESGRLPFADRYFDIVYCSSVIEHVTVPKAQIWQVRSGRDFRARARPRQHEFAREIRRLGKGYYVQTPNRWFPIESHTWLPLVGWLPRPWQVRVIAISNRCWIKRTSPDWHLLTARELRALFPGAEIRRERFMGLTKSLMAIRR
jgi:SAM-dependent methyltransferase